MRRVKLHGNRVDDAKLKTFSEKAYRIGQASLHMLDEMINNEAIGIDLGVVISIWRGQGDKIEVLPTFMSTNNRDLPALVAALREVADRLEAGDYSPPTNARGGDG